jgi:hypothetical protein
MNIVNVRVDRVSYRLSQLQDVAEVRESIERAVRAGGGFVRLDTDHNGEVFVMCSPGVSIVVSAAEQVETLPVSTDRRMDAAGLLYDPLFDHLL